MNPKLIVSIAVAICVLGAIGFLYQTKGQSLFGTGPVVERGADLPRQDCGDSCVSIGNSRVRFSNEFGEQSAAAVESLTTRTDGSFELVLVNPQTSRFASVIVKSSYVGSELQLRVDPSPDYFPYMCASHKAKDPEVEECGIVNDQINCMSPIVWRIYDQTDKLLVAVRNKKNRACGLAKDSNAIESIVQD